jgi:hypothetical protein
VRARIELYRDRVWLERALAVAAALCVAWVLLARPQALLGFPLDRYTLFPLSVGLGIWAPLAARMRWSAIGEIRREGELLVLGRGVFSRRIPLRRVHSLHVAPGERGASLVMQIDDGVIAAGMEDLGDAERLAVEIRAASGASADLAVPSLALDALMVALRPAAALFALGYYLHVVCRVLPGDKPLYGLGALFAGIALLVLHLIPRRNVRVGLAEARTLVQTLRQYPPQVRTHLWLHSHGPGPTEPADPRPRVVEHGEPLAEWFARTRRELSSPEGYRGPGQGIRARLEHAFRSAAVPLRERALALRVLAAGEPGEVKRRIAEVESLPAEEEAWLAAVALAEDDTSALARIARRPPDFVA